MNSKQASQPAAAPVFVPDFCPAEARRFVLISAILASSLGFIDGSVVAIALPAMRASLAADLVQSQWIHNAYMLALSALILLGGALGDKFGLARAFGAGIALFVLASMVCAFAPTVEVMIAARLFQGIGAAIMVPGSLAIIARAYPRNERGRAIGIWAAASAMTTALGPLLGGLALSVGGPEMWRAVFAVNLPLGGLALWLLWRKVGADPARSSTPLDIPGALLATGALLCIAWGLSHPGHMAAWLLAGSGIAVLFLWVQAHRRYPMIPLSLFANRDFSAANALSFALYAALGAMFFFMPMTFIAGWRENELDVSATFAPLSVLIAGLSAPAGRLADRIGPAPLIVAGSLLTALGYAGMGYFAHEQALWQRVIPAMCVVGLGMALVVAPLSSAVMGTVDETQAGIASGINNSVTRMAGLISVAGFSAVVASLYRQAGGTDSFGGYAEGAAHVAAMNAAFTGLAYSCAVLCLLSALIACIGLRRKQKPLEI